MTFRFKRSDPTVEAAVRRVATELANEILAALKSDDLPLDQSVHEARKTVKKLRGLVRLVKPRFPKAGSELDALRDAAARLAPLRDSTVLLSTFDQVAAAAGAASGDLSQSELEDLRAPFLLAFDRARVPRALARAVASFSDDIRALKARTHRWSLGKDGFAALAPGIERTWTGARTALADALDDNGTEALHTLRKRVKDHWYQARLLQPVGSEALESQIAVAGALGELLGQIHDLDVLIAALPATASARILAGAAETERARLVGQALPLARDFLAPPADELADRWRALWKSWRA